MQDTVQTLFNESIQTQVATADTVGNAVSRTIEKLVSCLLSGQRIFTCGDDSSAFVANHFSELLLHGSELERPPFPSIHLSNQARDLVNHECFGRQVSALGQPGDVLVVFVSLQHNERIHHAMSAALSRTMTIILLTGDSNGEATGLLGPDDIEIRIPSTVPARIIEQQLFLSQTFCDLIEASIFEGG
ncbi:MAG: SIS domain-containing protein [Idiomarina sp.]|nr:SIS domain-containing protein [Idiomarina sp.]